MSRWPRRQPASVDAVRVARLYENLSEPILRFFLRRVVEPQTALDLMAETFAQVVLSRRKFKGSTDAELAAWTYAIARGVLGTFVRRGVSERRAIARLGVETPQATDDELSRIEELVDLEPTKALIRDALADLTVDQRDVLQLRVVDELPYSEVALKLGITEDTARARVSRGLRALAAVIDERAETVEVSG